jgi:hypothetical protein
VLGGRGAGGVAAPSGPPAAAVVAFGASPPVGSAAGGVINRSKNPFGRSRPWVVTTGGAAFARAFNWDSDSRMCGSRRYMYSCCPMRNRLDTMK